MIRKHVHRNNLPLHLMLIPGVIFCLLFVYAPFAGSIMVFEDFNPVKGFFGSAWVGLENFRFLANLPNVYQVLWNTIYISLLKIIFNILVPVSAALLLNEIRIQGIKRTFQTIVYMPYFISWVVLSGIFINILSPTDGIVNKILSGFGIQPIFFLGDKIWFPITMVLTDVWKNFGFGTVIYLAALTSIDPNLYEAAMIDGAGRWKQTRFITLPGILPIIVLMSVLSLGNILNAGFDQIFNMLSPSVYDSGDVIDTFVYRLGMIQRQYSISAAVGLFKSVVSFLFIALSYYLADRFAHYRIF